MQKTENMIQTKNRYSSKKVVRLKPFLAQKVVPPTTALRTRIKSLETVFSIAIWRQNAIENSVHNLF